MNIWKIFLSGGLIGLLLCSALMLIVLYRLSPMLQSRRQSSMIDQHTEPVPRFGRFVKWTHHCCVGFFSNTLLFARSKCSAAVEFGAPWNNTRILDLQSSPASIFMGDSGSLFLGYSLAILSLWATKIPLKGQTILPLLILAIPILDS